ncbi:hypothetical protein [Streptomyces fumanus]|uniref:Uncharacterized protein n=1 Tax=Streptomyces fumanus TaxID=67302 RepID=A0A919DXT2_9ACTN|nr:hypothetical protein [Streptomyces fumanus]GHE96082.1 hypothetical protein GCM10018772_20160 [Streptomyces fumanus]
MSAPVDAEQAWRDLQRIRVPQERVYDELERSGSGGPGATWATAALMWVFLAGLGLDPPRWAVVTATAGYVALLAWLAVLANRRRPMRLHRSRYDWRSSVTFFAGALVTGGTVLGTGRLVEPMEPLPGSLVRATVSAAVFVLFLIPANRWATGSLRTRAEAGR